MLEKLSNRFADFMHDHFKSRRSWRAGEGWTFKFRWITIRTER